MNHSVDPQAGPVGAELWAYLRSLYVFRMCVCCWIFYSKHKHHTRLTNTRRTHYVDSVDERWAGVQQALSGLFCASLNQIGKLHSTRPVWSFPPSASASASAANTNTGTRTDTDTDNTENVETELRHGALPRENVCTENLTPWAKLLPCRNQVCACCP